MIISNFLSKVVAAKMKASTSSTDSVLQLCCHIPTALSLLLATNYSCVQAHERLRPCRVCLPYVCLSSFLSDFLISSNNTIYNYNYRCNANPERRRWCFHTVQL